MLKSIKHLQIKLLRPHPVILGRQPGMLLEEGAEGRAAEALPAGGIVVELQLVGNQGERAAQDLGVALEGAADHPQDRVDHHKAE